METLRRDIISPSIHSLTSTPAPHPISGSGSPGVVSVEPDRKEILLGDMAKTRHSRQRRHPGAMLDSWFANGLHQEQLLEHESG